MTSIREEIHCFINKTDARELADKLSNGIVSIIEKRIDSLKEQLDSKDDVIMISSLNWVKELLE